MKKKLPKEKRVLCPNSIANSTHPIRTYLVGCGGTGSHMLPILAQIDHGLKQLRKPFLSLHVYDHDRVTESNVGRQLFSPADIGQYKSFVLGQRVARHYGITIYSNQCEFSIGSVAVTNGPYIVISCVDSIASRNEIHKYVRHGDAIWIDVGNDKHTGQAIVTTLHEGVFAHPTFFDEFPDVKDSEEVAGCPTHLMYNSQGLLINRFMANIAGQMLWSLLTKYYLDYRIAYANLDTMTINSKLL